MEPNVERIQLLIDALRDPKYRQIRGRLKRGEDCFCADGLMCEVYRQNQTVVNVAWDGNRLIYAIPSEAFASIQSCPDLAPLFVYKWFFGNAVHTRFLVHWNDAGRNTFQEIAKRLEDGEWRNHLNKMRV